jgi:hypothetical protein
LLQPKRNKRLKIAKTFIALLFSFALLAGQFSFADAQPCAKQAKSCCKKNCCCAPADDSQSAPLPLLPTQTSSQNDWQLAASVAQLFIASVDTANRSLPVTHHFVPSPSAVPLYQRHCSFLI